MESTVLDLGITHDDHAFGDFQLFDLPAIEKNDAVGQAKAQSEMRVTFKTRNGEMLFRGLKGEGADKGKVGLTKTDDILSRIYEAIRHDDPFADQRLYDMHESMNALSDTMNRAEDYIKKEIHSKLKMSGASLKIEATQSAPFDVRLKTNFCRALIWEILRADSIILMVITARYREIIDAKTASDINKALMSSVWNILYKVFSWKATGVTRRDVKEGNKRFETASIENNKIKLTADILDQKIRSTFAPAIIVRPENDVRPLLEKAPTQSEKVADLKDALTAPQLSS